MLSPFQAVRLLSSSRPAFFIKRIIKRPATLNFAFFSTLHRHQQYARFDFASLPLKTFSHLRVWPVVNTPTACMAWPSFIARLRRRHQPAW